MGSAVGTVLPLAVTIAIFPIPVVAAVLLVGSDRGLAKGAAFAGAWAAGLVAIGGVVLAIAGGTDAGEQGGEPTTLASALLLALGLALLVLAAKQWRERPSVGDEAPTPGWMRTIDELTVSRAAAVGFALSGLNPKNVLLVGAAAVEISVLGLPAGEQAAALALFVLVASVGVVTPLVLTITLGERAQALLEVLREWMTRHSAAIMTVLFLVIGAKLIGDAISALSG